MHACVHVIYYLKGWEDAGLEKLDVESWDNYVGQRLAELGIAEYSLDQGVQILAIVLGPRHCIHEIQCWIQQTGPAYMIICQVSDFFFFI